MACPQMRHGWLGLTGTHRAVEPALVLEPSVDWGTSFCAPGASVPSVRSIVPVVERHWETPSTVTLRFSYPA
ncbi:MAG: hypothetical protein KGJ69_16540, partial [Thermoplasmata archaeon]|nr:hypothetical protein [Thermoplasmata archaeon]